jgi:hypothetical protein
MSEPFEAIAVEARQRKVLQHGFTAVFLRDDVIRFVTKEGLYLR